MPYTVAQQQFSGPLDLLLELIESKQQDIAELALAQVTEEFLAYVEREKNIRPQELADFLVVAARLLLLKSKALLPQEVLEEEGLSLEQQLKLYKIFVEASKKLDELWKQGTVAYGREVKPVVQKGFYPPKNATAQELRRVFADMLGRFELYKKLPQRALERVVSVKEKISAIRGILKAGQKSTFKSLIADPGSKADLIVTFLALLELVKQQEVRLKQGKHFDDIHISL